MPQDQPSLQESSPPNDQAAEVESYEAFVRCYPEYSATSKLDELRLSDFSRLDAQGHVYLDHTGGGLYAATQVRRHLHLLLDSVLGNPHSSNPTSLHTSRLVESCRHRVARFFNACEDEYEVVFTSNASQALKLVGESYPFQPGDLFLLTYDNHNSVNGIREFDRAHGAQTVYVPVRPPEMRVDAAELEQSLALAQPNRDNLFAYPAQSNFSGVQHPLQWIEKAQERGWDVLLDAAAFVPTNRLDLSIWKPDFVALSFYKMFGFPTGVGALIARRTALEKLHRPWFAGGTISVASVTADRYRMASGSAAFEDGTLDYANLPAIEFGLDFIESAGLETIHSRVMCLTGWLIRRLLRLRHSNGRRLACLYGPADLEGRGGTVAVNLHDARGAIIDHQKIERLAGDHGISLRTGCFCNPGAGELALGLSRDDIEACFRDSTSPMNFQTFRSCISPKDSGAVRISLGAANNYEDVRCFLEFTREFLQ